MFGKIAQIASVISAVTAVTTSLRAVGKSRENSGLAPDKVRKIILPYRIVTVIWFVLAVIFAAPSLFDSWAGGKFISLLLLLLFFLVLGGLLYLIWRRVLILKR